MPRAASGAVARGPALLITSGSVTERCTRNKVGDEQGRVNCGCDETVASGEEIGVVAVGRGAPTITAE